MPIAAAQALIKHYKTRKAVARALGRTPETVRLWLRDGIPLEVAIDVERRTGGLVTAERILREAKERTA